MDQQYVAQTQTSSCSSSSDAANRGDEIRVNDDQSPCVDAPLAQGTHVSPLDSAETVDPARASEGESSVDIAGGPPSARSAHATSTDITDITDSRRAGDGNSSQGHTRSGDGDDIHAGHAPATTNGNDDIIPTAAPAAFNLALDLSSVAPLDRAIVLQFVDVGGKPIRLSHLAASDHLRGLAAARGLELRKPYFVQRSHLYQCIQEDPFNTYVSLAAAIVTGAAAGDESGDHGHPPSSTALHMSTSDKQQQQLSPSSSDAAEYTNSSGNPLYGSPHGSALEKYSRQPAVRELEEKTVAFIQCSEQPVVLSRFAAHQGLRKLARLSGVELKKTFFTDRSGLFRVKEETPGNARVWLAADYNEDGFAPDSTGSREDGPMAPSSPAANVPAAAATSDLSTPLSDHSRTVEPALPSDSGSDSSSVNSSNTPLSMVDVGLLFLHRHTNGKYNPVAMNLFGLDQYLSQVASAEGSVWRRSFFMANHEFFLYHISGSTASITPTKQGHARITHLLKTSDKAQELVSSKNSASTRPVSKSEVLEAKVVEFLKSQPDQRTFLHNVGGDPVLRRLAAEADIALRKPFYESRPNVFRLTYLAETTVMVQLRHSGGGTGNAGAGGSGEQSQRSAAPEQRTATSQPSSTPGASGDTGHLWELLEKEIDTFFLEGKQRQYLLATVGNQPQIKKIASQLQVRVGKEYFMERARQYVLVDSDRAKAMLVGLTPKYYHSLRAALSEGNGDDDTISMASSNHSSSSYHSSGSARVGLGYAPDPTMRRLETIAVDSLLRAGGEKVSLPQLLKDPEMLAIKNKMTTKFDEFFFRRRPHLFSCSPTSSGILSLSLPEMTNRFNPLEQACVATLQRCPSFRSELGSLICSKSLERLVGGYTTADIRIAKAFFSARPDMFQVIQHGSRAEVELAEKYRKKPASAAGSSVIGVRDGGYGTETKPTQDLPTHGSQEISAKHDETKTEESHETPGLGDDEMAAWEEELAGADFHDGDDGDDTSNDDDSNITQQNTSRGGQFGVNSSTDRHQYPYYQQQATAAAAAVASSRQQQQQQQRRWHHRGSSSSSSPTRLSLRRPSCRTSSVSPRSTVLRQCVAAAALLVTHTPSHARGPHKCLARRPLRRGWPCHHTQQQQQQGLHHRLATCIHRAIGKLVSLRPAASIPASGQVLQCHRL
eukprot:scpid21418/ scgid19766/ 